MKISGIRPTKKGKKEYKERQKNTFPIRSSVGNQRPLIVIEREKKEKDKERKKVREKREKCYRRHTVYSGTYQ